MSTATAQPPKATATKPARKPASSAANRAGAKGLLAGVTTAAGLLPLELIEPDHFTNPRGAVDKKSPAFLELIASIKDRGVLQPIVVGPALIDGGKHPIVAGWRRYAAATVAKLAAIPVHQVTTTEAKDALVDGLTENVAREDMTPLAEARAIDTLMREHGYTQVAAGKAIGMAERTVRERLRLLKIHSASPVVGAAIDRGEVPMDAAVLLQQVAAVAPKLATAITANIGNTDFTIEPWSASDLAKPDEVAAIVDYLIYPGNETRDDGPLDVEDLLGWNHGGSFGGSDLPLTAEQLERWTAIAPEHDYDRSPPPIRFDEDDLTAARASGQVLEIEYKTSWGTTQTQKWVHASFFTTERIETKLAAMEKAGTARAKRREAERKAKAVETGKAGAVGLSAAESEKAAKAKAKEARERELAHHRNALLGERTTDEAMAKVAMTLPAAKLVALLILQHDAGEALERGVKYCDVDHLTEEVRRNGTVKRSYALTAPEKTSSVSDQLLRRRVLDAATPAAALAPVIRAYLLAREADQQVVAQSNRRYWSPPGLDEYRKTDIGQLIDEILTETGVLDGIDDAARERADAPPPGKPLSEVLDDDKPATSPIDASDLKGTRGDKVLALVTRHPGITIPELADALKLNQNVLYRTLPALEKDGKVTKQGRSWHPAEAKS